MNKLDLRAVRYFVAVATHRSFTKAAAELRVTQPSVSLGIRKLEAALGFPLFERSTRAVALTFPGARFLDAARELARVSAETAGLASRLAQGYHSRLTVGSSPYALLYEEREALVERFIRRHPDIDLSVRTHAQDELLERCASGELDLCFYTGIAAAVERFEWLALRSWPFELLVPRAHPLARLKRIPVNALRGETIAVFERRLLPELYDRLAETLKSKAQVRPQASPGSHPVAMPAFAAQQNTLAVTLSFIPLPETLTARLVRRPVAQLDVEITAYLVRARREGSAAANRFWNETRRLLAKRTGTRQFKAPARVPGARRHRTGRDASPGRSPQGRHGSPPGLSRIANAQRQFASAASSAALRAAAACRPPGRAVAPAGRTGQPHRQPRATCCRAYADARPRPVRARSSAA